MDKYDVQQKLGDGTYGVVLRAVLRRTGEVVAIKKMKQKFRTFEECTRLPEVIALRKLHSCPNVVRLREVFREPSGELSLVFEFMDCDLLAIIRRYKQVGIPQARIRNMCFQVVQGLAAIHRQGYFHRDMKPENILIKREGTVEVVKLADLGLAKETRCRPPFTDYVSTRWYRAPEILLQDRAYNSPVDMWAMGCIMVELFTGRPLFPGTNEQDQLFKIVTLLGSPSLQSWPEGLELARKLNRKFPQSVATALSSVFPSIPPLALDLIQQMLPLNPRHRITAAAALMHPYFQGLEPAEATPRPQIVPRQTAPANTAPSPHTKGPPVDWRDITRPSLDTSDSPQGINASQISATSTNASAMHHAPSSGSAYGYTSSASKPPLGTLGAGSSPLNHQYNSPAQRLPFGTMAANVAPLAHQPVVDVSRFSMSPAGQSTAAVRRMAYDLPPSGVSAPVNAATGATAAQAPHRYGSGAASPSIASLHQHQQQAAPAPLQQRSNEGVSPAPAYYHPATGVRQPNAMRDSFEGLLKAAGLDPKDLLMMGPTAPSVGGGKSAESTTTPPTTTLAATGTSAAAAQQHQQQAGGSGIKFGRRRGAGEATTPEPNEENLLGSTSLPATVGGVSVRPVGESPLAKLLGQARYRAANGNGVTPSTTAVLNPANTNTAAAAATVTTTTFKSPSFARKPSPLSVSVLQQHHLRSSSALGMAPTDGAAGAASTNDAAFDALAAAEALLAGGTSTRHPTTHGDGTQRQLFTTDDPPPLAERHVVGVAQHAPAMRAGRVQPGGQLGGAR